MASNPNLEIVDLDLKFAKGSVRTTPAQTTSLARLRHPPIICGKLDDINGLLSHIHLPRGICLEVSCPQLTFGSRVWLPSLLTHIRGVLAPFTTARFRVSPGETRVSGTNGSLFLRYSTTEFFWDPEFFLSPTTSFREFHVNVSPWTFTPEVLFFLLTQFPALKTFVVAEVASFATGTFDRLAGESPFCPSLETIGFFNCGLTAGELKEFEDVVVKRHATTVTWLYRVVIVSSTGALPDYTPIQRLRQLVPCVNVGVDEWTISFWIYRSVRMHCVQLLGTSGPSCTFADLHNAYKCLDCSRTGHSPTARRLQTWPLPAPHPKFTKFMRSPTKAVMCVVAVPFMRGTCPKDDR